MATLRDAGVRRVSPDSSEPPAGEAPKTARPPTAGEDGGRLARAAVGAGDGGVVQVVQAHQPPQV